MSKARTPLSPQAKALDVSRAEAVAFDRERDQNLETIHVAEVGVDLVEERLVTNENPVFSISKVGPSNSVEKTKPEVHWAELFNPNVTKGIDDQPVDVDSGLMSYLIAVEKKSGVVTRGFVVERKLTQKAEGYLADSSSGLGQILDMYLGLEEQSATNMFLAESGREEEIVVTSKEEAMRWLLTSSEDVMDAIISLAHQTPNPSDILDFVEGFINDRFGEVGEDIKEKAEMLIERLLSLTAINFERKLAFWENNVGSEDEVRRAEKSGSKTKLQQRFIRVNKNINRAADSDDRLRSDLIDRQLGYLD